MGLTVAHGAKAAGAASGNDNVVGTDWDPGFWKADCGESAANTGLSASSTSAQALLCLSQNPSCVDTAADVLNISSGNEQLAFRFGDWDPGYWKAECALKEYVSGMSMNPTTNALHGVRCATDTKLDDSWADGGANECETHGLTQGDDRGYTDDGDWDPGFNKAECALGKFIYGVSVTTAGAPHAILCCDE